MTPQRYPHRRAEDDRPAVRLTGHTARQLAVQVAGGALIALASGIAAAMATTWRQAPVTAERLESLTREVQQLRGDMQDIRRDLYHPRFERGGYSTGMPMPPGRP